MKILTIAALLVALTTFTSCQKDYTCTCTTVVGTTSTETSHTIGHAKYTGAVRTCDTYQDEANKVSPGSTTCRL